MHIKRRFDRFLSIILAISILLMTVGCSSTQSPPPPTISDPNPQTFTERIEQENLITENEIHEFITTENYLEELVIAEDKIVELLLEEETISEVLYCKSVYVPQANIDEFSNNSQTTNLFGDGVKLGPLLKKIAVGTGVIVTTLVLKKVGFPDPIASVVTSAADEALKFAGTGAAIGSLFGGITGATGEIDKSGRTSAVIGFATALAGLVLSAVSFISSIPSGGITTATLSEGIKLVVAGVITIGAAVGTVQAGKDAIKTFKATDGFDVDWDNIDWDRVGVSAAKKSIENAADGYMWGSIIGAVHGGAEGYDFYHKYHTPYTDYNKRLVHTPAEEGSGGKWSGKRGESDFILDEPIKLPDGTTITKVKYQNAVPDFSPYQKAQVKIPKMTNKRYGADGNFRQADTVLAEYWTKTKHLGKKWTVKEVETYRTSNNLTWHEMSNMESMQLVPFEVNQRFTHYGGVAEYNAMINQEGEMDFD